MEHWRLRQVPAGTQLFDRGDLGDEAFLVQAGLVEIQRIDADGSVPLAQLGPGELFGELALLGEHLRSRTARAVAIDDSELLVIPRERMERLMAGSDPLLKHLLRLNLIRTRSLLMGEDAGLDPEALNRELQAREPALERLRLERDIDLALDQQQFELHYQPLVRLLGGGDPEIAGFEALLRWRRPPEGGWLSPATFIPVAEASGQIVPLGRWVIDAACAGLAALLARAGRPLTVSVNLSVAQFDDAGLPSHIDAALARHGLPPETLKLEITESVLMGHFDRSYALLRSFRDRGLGLSIDDFGTGYSSLAYLHRLPVTTLKLDRAFLRDLPSAAAEQVVASVAALAGRLGLDTVAEGVETAEQARHLTRMGVDQLQGFWYSPGRPLDQALALLGSRAQA